MHEYRKYAATMSFVYKVLWCYIHHELNTDTAPLDSMLSAALFEVHCRYTPVTIRVHTVHKNTKMLLKGIWRVGVVKGDPEGTVSVFDCRLWTYKFASLLRPGQTPISILSPTHPNAHTHLKFNYLCPGGVYNVHNRALLISKLFWIEGLFGWGGGTGT